MKDIISIDETSIKSAMIKEYCRTIKGKRCYFKTTDNKVFRKYTLLMAISTKGVVAYKFYEKGGSNKDRFLDFLAMECSVLPDKSYSIELIFSGDSIIKISTEVIEVTLDDQGAP